MKTPIRVQRSRAKGWKMPENTIYVGRPTLWGNPYQVGAYIMGNCVLVPGKVYDTGDAVDCFDAHLASFKTLWPDFFETWIKPLRGKNLACWCTLDMPCHADSLLKAANE